jgi:glycosyltransferase involved in cell wall biosynthesis
VPVASLRAPAIGRLVRRLRGPAEPVEVDPTAETTTPPGAGPVHEAVAAAMRARQMATNVARLRRLVRAARPDVVHVNNGGYPGAESCRALSLAAAAEGVPSIVHFVHNMAYAPSTPRAVELALDRRVDAAVTGWATAAHRASDRLAEVRAIPRERIATVHYGIPAVSAPEPAPAEELGFAPDALNLACVAAFEPRKGHRTLLEAVATARAQGLDVRVALVGVGEESDAVRRRMGELGLGDSVRFLGWRADVDAVLAAADALVLPSLSNECLPYAILEAMGLGLAVVGTDVAGIPEEIDHGTTGLVVHPGDAGELARALADLASRPEARKAMGEAGRARLADAFSRRRMVEETVALWDQAGRRKTPSM